MRAQLFLLTVLTVLAGCWDYSHIDAVSNLGPETPGIPTGPRHRPGQPCTTCHDGRGPSDFEISVGGTVYTRRYSDETPTRPLAGAKITVTDTEGDSRVLVSNDAGNFYVARAEWDPAFPLRVVLEAEGVRREMTTMISREGGCGACHRGAGDRNLMPAVFLRDR